ncbi:MAG: FAD-dependent oxidoreductase [Proteobacteria bacterium]|nr:FAD-dependent oxidoreductase [Pseudomonadota bacterium]
MTPSSPRVASRLNIAVVGTGISGMSAAWLLSERHDVTVYESASRIGGHSNTVDAPQKRGSAPVDTGFIVYNELNYPNLAALFKHLDVPTKTSDMTFAVSLDDGKVEYAAKDLKAFLARPRNFFSPRFWSMAADLVRFYRRAVKDISPTDSEMITLGDYLDAEGYGEPFQKDHLLPQAAAIWSASPDKIRDYPACAFVRFFENHGLLNFIQRPAWRTVEGGSRAYVERLTARYAERVRTGSGVKAIVRTDDGVLIRDAGGRVERFDEVVIATHADQALALLQDPTAEERELLGAFRYSRNLTVLHTDARLMPSRKALWSSWNYVGRSEGSDVCCVSYWMNALQGLKTDEPLFVTLNPHLTPRPDKVIHTEVYEHPIFDAAAVRAQRRIWSLQGRQGTWFCGAHFGSGFHEDGLQSGLAVAEQLGGVRRPWSVAGESDRIYLTPPAPRSPAGIAA